jgi:hypothetical protein
VKIWLSLDAGMNLLIFAKDGWQYILTINKLVADKASVTDLIDIANSLK